MHPWNSIACVQQLSLPASHSLAKGSCLLGKPYSGLWNRRTFSTYRCSFLPWPHVLANLDRRLSWWNQLPATSLLLQLQLCYVLVQIFFVSTVQVCILGWRWDDVVWSSYKSWAYPRVSKRRRPSLPLRRRLFSLSLKLGVLFRSSIL